MQKKAKLILRDFFLLLLQMIRAFLYSVYFDMYAYAARYLYLADSNALKQISNTLSPAVKNDIKELTCLLSEVFYTN